MTEILKFKKQRKKETSRAKHVPKKDTSIVQKRAKKYLRFIKSEKNIRLNEINRAINKVRKTKMKNACKKVIVSLKSNNLVNIKSEFQNAQSKIMRALKNNLIKKNKASRMVCSLNKKVKVAMQNKG